MVLAAALDGIEVGDVQLVEPQRVADPARDRQRFAARAVAFALAAHGVHRRAVLKIDDRYDAH